MTMNHKGTTHIRTMRRAAGEGLYDQATYVDGELYGHSSKGITADQAVAEADELAATVAGEVKVFRYEMTDPTQSFYYTFAAFHVNDDYFAIA